MAMRPKLGGHAPWEGQEERGQRAQRRGGARPPWPHAEEGAPPARGRGEVARGRGSPCFAPLRPLRLRREREAAGKRGGRREEMHPLLEKRNFGWVTHTL